MFIIGYILGTYGDNGQKVETAGITVIMVGCRHQVIPQFASVQACLQAQNFHETLKMDSKLHLHKALKISDRVPQTRGTLLRGFNSKHYCIWRLCWSSPYLRKLP